MATSTRIYLATIGDKQRLVRASRPSVALTHVAEDLIKVRVPTQEEFLTAIVTHKIKVETAGEEPQQEIPS